MYEVELKVRADHDAVRERLGEVGAERLGRVRQVDTYYDAPHRDFAATDEALRVREETAGDDAVYRLTYKGPKVDDASKTRAEHESRIGDPDAVDAALRALGFDPVAEVEKERERYALRGFTVTLDEVDGLGAFVEVEREAPTEDLERVRDDARDLLTEIGLDPETSIRTSYLGLLLDELE